MDSLIVVQMHGEPGSGKSTLARAIAPLVGAILLDKDVIKSAILRSGVADGLAGPAAYEVYFDLAGQIVHQGYSLILDNPVFWPRVEERWLALSAAAACPPLLIECVCPDRNELCRRLASRNGLESHPKEPIDLLRHAGAAETRYMPRLTLDTTRPVDELVGLAAGYIRSTTKAAWRDAGERSRSPLQPSRVPS
jgi:predicted kinase